MTDDALATEAAWRAIPGGPALLDWFGQVPRFHDAELMEITLRSRGPSTLRLHAWTITDAVDAGGYFVTDCHAVVTFTLEEVTRVDLVEYGLPGIVLDLALEHGPEGVRLAWSGSYGVEGEVAARRARIDLAPGRP